MIGLLFDLDGTLLDTLEDLYDSVNHILSVYHYPLRTMQEIRSFIGNGVSELVRLSLPEGCYSDEILSEFRAYYADHCRMKTKPYDGMTETISFLAQDYPTAIVSNKPDAAVKKLCADFFPGIYAMGQSEACPRKPAPDMILKAMERIGVTRCIYIGDSEVDILTAKNAGVPCISVLWGFRDKAELKRSGAEYFCALPGDLPSVISGLNIRINEGM